jgi:hypothetical protein
LNYFETFDNFLFSRTLKHTRTLARTNAGIFFILIDTVKIRFWKADWKVRVKFDLELRKTVKVSTGNSQDCYWFRYRIKDPAECRSSERPDVYINNGKIFINTSNQIWSPQFFITHSRIIKSLLFLRLNQHTYQFLVNFTYQFLFYLLSYQINFCKLKQLFQMKGIEVFAVLMMTLILVYEGNIINLTKFFFSHKNIPLYIWT